MTIKNTAIATAVTDYVTRLEAKSDKTALGSDIRDLVEGFVTAQTGTVKAPIEYNANGLHVRKGVVRWMGTDVDVDDLPDLVQSEAASTLLEIKAAMLAKLTARDKEE